MVGIEGKCRISIEGEKNNYALLSENAPDEQAVERPDNEVTIEMFCLQDTHFGLTSADQSAH